MPGCPQMVPSDALPVCCVSSSLYHGQHQQEGPFRQRSRQMAARLLCRPDVRHCGSRGWLRRHGAALCLRLWRVSSR